MMTNDDHQGQIFLSHPNWNNGFVFLFTTKYLISSLPEKPEYADMRLLGPYLCFVSFLYLDLVYVLGDDALIS